MMAEQGRIPQLVLRGDEPMSDDKSPLPPTIAPPSPDPPTLLERPGGEKNKADSLPRTVGGYRLLRRLGGGGMGSVFEAEEAASGRRVALKFLAPELADSPEALARFRSEGRLASAIAHPRCVFVIAADEDAGRPYIVMELMPGDTLADLVQRIGPLPQAQAVAQVLDVLEGLQEAHRAGVIHRDVKPSNCFLSADGRVKVGDFGLARSLLQSGHLTSTGTFLGTPQFASPEQIKSQPLDARTDIYSLGATLYFLLAGKVPYEGGDGMAVMARIVSEPPPPLRGLRPEISPGLERVALRALERDRQRRFQSLDEFRRALLPFSPQSASPAKPGWRLGAHLVDCLLFAFLGPDFGLLALVGSRNGAASPETRIALYLVWNSLWIVYFTVLEGRWGWSLGKLLFGLRVVTAGTGDSPGLVRGLARTLTHFAIVYLASLICQLLAIEQANEGLEWAALAALWLGALLLLSTMRRRNGYRAPQDLLSGTCVVAVPSSDSESLGARLTPERRRAAECRPADAPECLGPFVVEQALCWGPQQHILVGRDPGLGREVWITLHAISDPPLSTPRRELNRPARLRWLGGGVQRDWQWDAYFAPLAMPATELVREGQPLGWHQARPLLEQLVQELVVACDDGTLPTTLTLDQVWIGRGGQMLLLDSPPDRLADPGEQPAPRPDQERALTLLKQVAVKLLDQGGPACDRRPNRWKRWGISIAAVGVNATAALLLLRGQVFWAAGLLILGVPAGLALAREIRRQGAWARRGHIRSPLPRHADALLSRLVGIGQPYATTMQQMWADLEATRERPTRVTSKIRLAHLATLGSFLAPCLIIMFVLSRIVHAVMVETVLPSVVASEKMLAVLDRGQLAEYVKANMGKSSLRKLRIGSPPVSHTVRLDREGVIQLFSAPGVRERVESRLAQQRSELQRHVAGLNFVERLWLGADLRHAEKLLQYGRGVEVKDFDDFLDAAGVAVGGSPNQEAEEVIFWMLAGAVLLVPVCWVVWAYLWRGGLTYRLLGLVLVRGNGLAASRLQCAWRALVIWGTVGPLLFLSMWLNEHDPELGRWSWAAWAAALVLLLTFAGLALRWPSRAFHDRLAGTYLVPQ
jgi:hypothetical protein